jgi:hypothetical protein
MLHYSYNVSLHLSLGVYIAHFNTHVDNIVEIYCQIVLLGTVQINSNMATDSTVILRSMYLSTNINSLANNANQQ